MTQLHWRLLIAVLWVLVLASALGVVYGKQEARNRFSELQKLTLYARGSNSVELADVMAVMADASTLALDELIDAAAVCPDLPTFLARMQRKP